MEVRTWLNEFGEDYRPDPQVLDLLTDERVMDESWHNDIAPHFSADAGGDQRVELWFYRADPNDRADEGDSIPADAEQYHVYLTSDDGMTFAPEQLHTNDAALAVMTFKGLMQQEAK